MWTWRFLEQLEQDFRYALRAMIHNRGFTALAVLSLALGIGANTAIYSFMDSILLRSLPVADPASLVALTWRSKPIEPAGNARDPGSSHVLHSLSGRTYNDPENGTDQRHFPFSSLRAVLKERCGLLHRLRLLPYRSAEP